MCVAQTFIVGGSYSHVGVSVNWGSYFSDHCKTCHEMSSFTSEHKKAATRGVRGAGLALGRFETHFCCATPVFCKSGSRLCTPNMWRDLATLDSYPQLQASEQLSRKVDILLSVCTLQNCRAEHLQGSWLRTLRRFGGRQAT